MSALLAITASCGFNLSAAPTDGGPGNDADAPSMVTAGFSLPTSTVDEDSMDIMIDVELSEPAAETITVDYALTGSALLGVDYTGSPGTLTFNALDRVRSIPLRITKDAVDELDETIVITLTRPSGAVIGLATHTVTINANTLPRVNLAAATSNVPESTQVTLNFTLDQPSTDIVTATYMVVAGTATATPPFQDYTLSATGVVTFPAMTTMQSVSLGVVPDTRNELDETLTVTITASTGAIIGPTAAQVHTIANDDAVPTVVFTQASSSTTEADGGATTTVSMAVSLLPASGRTVIVPFAVNTGGTTATSPSDYLLSASPLTFAEGVTTQQITVTVVGDTVNETNETVAVSLLPVADGAATLATPSTRVLTIIDNDPWCQGVGTYSVCLPAPPTSAVVLPSTIVTDAGSSDCLATLPTGWTSQGQPDSCFVVGTMITMTQNTAVTGSRPLVLVASGDISISLTLDVASHRGGDIGPGSPSSACPAFVQTPTANLSSGGGGGAGASFMSKGGDGGTGNAAASSQGLSAAAAASAPTVLRAGCDGQRGARSSGNDSGSVGRGGGAVFLLAVGSVGVTGEINASGSAGAGGDILAGGSGAGSGGMIVLQGGTLSTGSGELMANGGGGASGGDNNDTGSSGSDPVVGTPNTPAAGGPVASAGGAGGAGFAGTTAATNGSTGSGGKGGGGGGGGGGYIKASAALNGAVVSAGRIDAP